MSNTLRSGPALALQPGHAAGVQAADYCLRQAADMEQFARTACSIAQHEAFLLAAARYRALARDAVAQPAAAE
jgi:hypothetical protein